MIQKSLLTLVLLSLGSIACGQSSIDELEQRALYEAATKAAPSVLRIETIGGLEKVDDVLVSTGSTSAVVVHEDGLLISSAFNFVQEPSSILVELPNGTRKAAEILARDESRKLVLLKVDVDEPLVVPEVSPKSDLRVGQWTVTVGRTLPGEDFNVSSGIVSATNRVWSRAVQTDANVSPANYGGALVDVRGRVIGVLVPLSPNSNDVVAGAEWYDSGIGFAIPLEDILAHLDRLRDGDIHAGLLGISLKGDDIYGLEAVIGVVRPKSPARDSGLKAGDKIVAINGTTVRKQSDLKHLMGPMLAGDTLTLEVERGDEKVSAELKLIAELVPYEHAFLGILPMRGDDEEGVAVRYVFTDSPADKAGLKPGDRILALGETPIADATALREGLAAFEPGTEVTIQRKRDEQEEAVTITLDSIPDSIPAEIPNAYPELAEYNEDLPTLGKINIKLPEEEGECHAYIPETYDPRLQHGLVVLLPVPGKDQIDSLIKQWREQCDQTRTILLMPQAKETRSWLPTETAFIRKTIENLRTGYSLDPERVTVIGADNSGAMAFLTGMTHRDLIRGVAAIRSPVPGRAPSVYNEPLQRIAFYVAVPQDSPMKKRIEANIQKLRKDKFSVTRTTADNEGGMSESQRAELLRWVDILDRL